MIKCWDCDKEAAPNRTRCEYHLKKAAERANKYASQRTEQEIAAKKTYMKGYNEKYREENKEELQQHDRERSLIRNRDPHTKERKREWGYTQKGKLCHYRSKAKVRGIEFALTKEEFATFWQKPCHYCGCEIATIGLDRIDSSLGYSVKNCVSCCTFCNQMKLDHDTDEWMDKMLAVLKYQGVI
jgi:hypothetical protein